MTVDSIADSVLVAFKEFDIERLERLVLQFRKEEIIPEVSRDELTVDEAAVEEHPIQLRDSQDPPLWLCFARPNFYIRDCYKVYYDLITACLNSGKYFYLTIVGTPGTGKSLFYLYVFRRYRLEHPDVTIVAAAFDKERVLMDCWVYEAGKDRVCFDKTIPDIDGALYLYDGPPLQCPRSPNKMVCFTCPNYRWMDKYARETCHVCLWFPAWTYDELLEANEVCELQLSEDTLRNRFNFFGGSARYCLSFDSISVSNARTALESKILLIDSLDKLSVCLRGGEGNDALSHQLFHSHPGVVEAFPFVATYPKIFFPCSREVGKLIGNRIVQKNEANYYSLIGLISEEPRLACLRGDMFERFAHESIERGRALELHALDATFSNLTVAIPVGVYQRMKAGCESVDGVALVDDALLLFQATVADTHPVKANGILEQLQRVGKLDEFMNGTFDKVYLIFLIPPKSRQFNKQQILVEEPYDDNSEIRHIKGMRNTWLRALKKKNVLLVHQLRKWLETADSDDRERYTPYLAGFDKRNLNAQYNGKVEAIPQYYVTLTRFSQYGFPITETIEEYVENLENINKELMEKNESLQRQLDAQTGA